MEITKRIKEIKSKIYDNQQELEKDYRRYRELRENNFKSNNSIPKNSKVEKFKPNKGED